MHKEEKKPDDIRVTRIPYYYQKKQICINDFEISSFIKFQSVGSPKVGTL